MTQKAISINNLVRSTTFFQHAGIAITFVFMPIIALGVTSSLFEIGLIVASFSFAMILSEIYFGRISDKKGSRLIFIRVGLIGCAVTFGLHYFADDAYLLLLARLGAGITSGIMIPAMVAYTYEASKEKAKVATIISFHALGWLAGILAAGVLNDERVIFLASSAFFLVALGISTKLPKVYSKKELGKGLTKSIIVKNKFLFSSLLLRHTGAAAVWTILPIILMRNLGAELYEISIVYIANTLSAFIVMNLLGSKLRINNVTKFKIGLGLTIFVFIGLSLITDWWLAMPFMALVGVSWAFFYIGGNIHLMENNPKSTSTGIFNSTISISQVIGPVIAGSIGFLAAQTSVMYFAVVICICAFLVSLKIKK